MKKEGEKAMDICCVCKEPAPHVSSPEKQEHGKEGITVLVEDKAERAHLNCAMKKGLEWFGK